jgi:hypothetical protein
MSLIYQRGLKQKVLKQLAYTVIDQEIVVTVKVLHTENCLVITRRRVDISKFLDFFFFNFLARVCCDWYGILNLYECDYIILPV